MYVYISAIKCYLFIILLASLPSIQEKKSLQESCYPPNQNPDYPTFTLGNSGRGFLYNPNLTPLSSTTSLPAAEQQPRQPLHNVQSRLRYMQSQRVSTIMRETRLGASCTVTYIVLGLPPPSPRINFLPARSDLAAGKHR